MKEKIIERLLKELEEKKDLLFTEIEEIFEEEGYDYKGKRSLLHPKDTNLVMWMGWNEGAIDIIGTLLEIPEMFLIQCTTIETLTYSEWLNLPIAKTDKRVHTKPYWFPVKLNYRKN